MENELGLAGVAATVSARCRDAVVVITRVDACLANEVVVSLHAGAENEALSRWFADCILLNKIDLATGPELVAVEQRQKGINAFAPIINLRSTQGPSTKS